MDIISHLRRLQADGPSSDEESAPRLSPASSLDRYDRSSVSDTTTLTVPSKSDEEEKASAATTRRKREATAEPGTMAGKDDGKPQRAAKKAKIEPQTAGNELPRAEDQQPLAKLDAKSPPQAIAKAPGTTVEPAQHSGEKKLQKRKLDDDHHDRTRPGHQPASEKAKPNSGKPGKQASNKAESSKGPSSNPGSQKPVHEMEYFERRVHQMLSQPIDFDDLVYDSKKQPPAYVKRSFARYRRKQRQPTPPLEMSGALGPAEHAKPASTKRQQLGSLARKAQKRAHQENVKDQVNALKKAVSVSPAEKGGVKSMFVNGQQTPRPKATLSAHLQQGSVKGKSGGQQQATSPRKYTQSTYSEVASPAVVETPDLNDTADISTKSGIVSNAGGPAMSAAHGSERENAEPLPMSNPADEPTTKSNALARGAPAVMSAGVAVDVPSTSSTIPAASSTGISTGPENALKETSD